MTILSGYVITILINMKRLGDYLIYIGVKKEHEIAVGCGMKVVCALNRAKGFVTHQSVVGWEGRGCDSGNLYYLYKRDCDAIYLNMIDGDRPEYVNDVMVNAALDFISYWVDSGSEVFIYCSRGESRAPSIALMWLLENGMIERCVDTVKIFKRDFYRGYIPKSGNLLYIKRRWKI